MTGKYFDNMQHARSSKLTHDRGVQERLWKVAEDLKGGLTVTSPGTLTLYDYHLPCAKFP